MTLKAWLTGLVATAALAGAAVLWAVHYHDIPAAIVAVLFAGLCLLMARQSVLQSQPALPVISARLPQAMSTTGPMLERMIAIEALADPVVIVGRDGRIVAASASVRALANGPVDGEDLRIVFRQPAILEAIAEARQVRGAAIERDLADFGAGHGEYRLRVQQLEDQRYILVFRDVSQTRLAERMRVDFVANASHELRTPLATLIGFIETLQDGAIDDAGARQRFLAIMAREAARMARLIDDLLSLSRIELDKYQRPTSALNLAPLVSEVAGALSVKMQADNRELDLMIEDGLPPVIADRDQILQVLHNLMSNALKYGASATPITVSARRLPQRRARDEAMVEITVADHGEGIALEHLPRLTERFYRVDTGRSRTMGGTGLGLAIVKHIIERHRGTLSIDSTPGEGTRVSFTLPVHVAVENRVPASLSQN